MLCLFLLLGEVIRGILRTSVKSPAPFRQNDLGCAGVAYFGHLGNWVKNTVLVCGVCFNSWWLVPLLCGMRNVLSVLCL